MNPTDRGGDDGGGGGENGNGNESVHCCCRSTPFSGNYSEIRQRWVRRGREGEAVELEL